MGVDRVGMLRWRHLGLAHGAVWVIRRRHLVRVRARVRVRGRVRVRAMAMARVRVRVRGLGLSSSYL